ncbi:hypothetical protein Mapa_011775 [Marchantia paleacea]|nr:hypothetical protein Mapa_011775 [Marchantia paleacea]
MPGSIHVTVLEAVDLPAELKVSLGSQDSTTRYINLEGVKTAPWDSDFAFPVLNLKDRLAVAICDPEGETLTKCEIEVPSILQQGYREEFVTLSKGGRLHLKLSFVLTDEERKKVNEMRAAAQRKKEKEQKDEMMVRRSNNLTKSIEVLVLINPWCAVEKGASFYFKFPAYDFKRKEDYCTDNGLRTIAESEVEHAGKSLDNWEVFSRKKDKEVSPASLFALPQPPQPPTLKPSPSVETEKPVEVSADRERCSKNKYSSSCNTMDGVLCHSSLNQDNIVEEPTVTTGSPPENPESQANSETELGTGPPKTPIPEITRAAPIVLPEIDEQKENRPAPLISVDSNCRMGSQDDHVFCHAPEVEDRMEIRLLENRQEELLKKELSSNQGFSRPREENPFLPKSLLINGSVQQECDIAANQVHNFLKEDRATIQVFSPKENVATLQESASLVQGVVAAVRMSTFREWESIRKMPRVKEEDRTSAKLSPHAHAVKDFPLEVQTGSGEKVRTTSSTPEAKSPRLEAREIEENVETVSSNPETGSPKLGERGVEEKISDTSSSPKVVIPKLSVRGTGEKTSNILSAPEVVNSKLGISRMEENVGSLSSSIDLGKLDVGARVVEEKIRFLSSAPTDGSPKVGLHHLEVRQTGSPRLLRTALSSFETYSPRMSRTSVTSHESDSPRLSKTFAKVEKNPGLLSRLLSDDCTSMEKKSSILTSAKSLPMEGWVCVEHPPMTWEDPLKAPMTWEDALKVAQEKREAAIGPTPQPASPLPPSSLLKMPTYNLTGPPSPVTPMGAARVPTSFSLPSAQDVMCAPLPRPPKSNPSKASITAGYVKAHIESFESGSNQTLDQPSGNVGNFMMQTETSSPTGVQVEIKKRRSGEEELIKWEETVRNWGQSAELKDIQEESRHRNQGTEKLSWDMDDFEDSIRKDFEARLQSPSSDCESTSSRLAVPAAEVRWDVEDSTRINWLGEVTEVPTTDEGCLDLFEDLNVEDMEGSLMEEADLIIESLCKSLEPAADFFSSREVSSRELTPDCTEREDSEPPTTDEEKQKISVIGGTLKQVLGGAVLAAGVFVLWPKNAGNTERYHVVKTGETLSNILPEQSIDPSSRFCKLNPQVCERKTVYPGQRLRLA